MVGSGEREGLRMRPRWQALAPGKTVGPSTEIEDERSGGTIWGK